MRRTIISIIIGVAVLTSCGDGNKSDATDNAMTDLAHIWDVMTLDQQHVLCDDRTAGEQQEFFLDVWHKWVPKGENVGDIEPTADHIEFFAALHCDAIDGASS